MTLTLVNKIAIVLTLFFAFWCSGFEVLKAAIAQRTLAPSYFPLSERFQALFMIICGVLCFPTPLASGLLARNLLIIAVVYALVLLGPLLGPLFEGIGDGLTSNAQHNLRRMQDEEARGRDRQRTQQLHEEEAARRRNNAS